MSEWKHLSLECDSLQNRRWGDGPQVTDSLPPQFPHFCRLDGSVNSSVTPSFLSDKVCVYKAWDRRATKITSSPSLPLPLSGRNRSVGSHTLFISGSFKWCPGTHISCLFESVYVTGEAVKQQFAFTPAVYLFSYVSVQFTESSFFPGPFHDRHCRVSEGTCISS